MTNLIIVGARRRAAAMSAVEAGFEPWCVDLFADTDLQAIAPAEACASYPDGLPEALENVPSGHWIYTGALENRPDVLARMMTKRHRLLGNAPDIVRAVRDPAAWGPILATGGCDVPRFASNAVDVPTDGSWLRKPLASGNGTGVRAWHGEVEADSENAYFQERISGVPYGAVFVAAERNVVFLGASRQLIAVPWCLGDDRPEREFAYCGSIGPTHFDDPVIERWQAIGSVLAREFGLVGLFGVDAILTPDRRLFVLEINPRYTASIEVLERASLRGTSGNRGKRLLAIAAHVNACREGKLPDRVLPVPGATAGKAILYAAPGGMTRFPVAAAQWAAVMNLSSRKPAVADIPVVDTTHSPGRPILTVLAEGADEDDVREKLIDLAAEARDVLEFEES
ncbi:MAG: ATP-grasp domain-containing protein [Pirellulales bacterium]